MGSLNQRVDRLEHGNRSTMVFEVWTRVLDEENLWENTKTAERLAAEQLAERGFSFTLEFDRPETTIIKVASKQTRIANGRSRWMSFVLRW